MFSTEPKWTQSKELWSEDECTLNDPDAEKTHQAWERLFNSPFDDKGPKIDTWDGGDVFYELYSQGRVVSYSYCGSSISHTLTSL